MKRTDNNKKENTLKDIFVSYPVTVPAIAVCIALCLVLFFYNIFWGLAGLVVTIVITLLGVVKSNISYKRLEGAVSVLEKKLSVRDDDNSLKSFPLPVVLFDSTDKIIWYNSSFYREFLEGKAVDNVDIKSFTGGQGIDTLRNEPRIECELDDKKYTAITGSMRYKNETLYALYYMEDTELKNYRGKYHSTRPVFMIINLDSIDETFNDMSEGQQTDILGDLEVIIENWFESYNCIFRKIHNGRFVIISEYDKLVGMMEDKFSLLSQVRSHTYKDKVLGITLSMGVGCGNNLQECEKIARKSLDMAMGRGGDQVAVKILDRDYEFFGGVSKGVEKRTKVRTRMIANAIKETIRSSDNVLVMGHRFADLDALGSSVGVAMLGRALGKDVRIVMSSKTTLSMPLVKHLKANGMNDLIIEPESIDNYLSPKTLLVIVDTHRKNFLEYPELFDLADRVVVIDHHRKTVDHINKAVVFYHEPNASSASEMVTELIQYIDVDVEVPPVCAEALMSGITLDTKNFVMKTGVRTFEAAAYLRSLGADTVAVKQLFSNSMKTQKAKSEVVKNAAMYGDCAVGVVDFESEDIRIVASQAADELLNTDGVHGSFVMFKTGDTINISARSYGEINVQLVMEQLGGGGHQTMAAAQLEGESFDGALTLLRQAIDKVR